MPIIPKAVSRVIESFEKLPGIGPKTAQRLTFYLLHVPEDEIARFASCLTALKADTVTCGVCKNVAEKDPCDICSDPTRDGALVCVVEQPTDVLSIERTGTYKGRYHVLHGVIDPLNNIGPDELFIDALIGRLKLGEAKELIVALDPDMEGEATALYLRKRLEEEGLTAIRVSRIAHGLPVGADIEYADDLTLRRALEGRRTY